MCVCVYKNEDVYLKQNQTVHIINLVLSIVYMWDRHVCTCTKAFKVGLLQMG